MLFPQEKRFAINWRPRRDLCHGRSASDVLFADSPQEARIETKSFSGSNPEVRSNINIYPKGTVLNFFLKRLMAGIIIIFSTILIYFNFKKYCNETVRNLATLHSVPNSIFVLFGLVYYLFCCSKKYYIINGFSFPSPLILPTERKL